MLYFLLFIFHHKHTCIPKIAHCSTAISRRITMVNTPVLSFSFYQERSKAKDQTQYVILTFKILEVFIVCSTVIMFWIRLHETVLMFEFFKLLNSMYLNRVLWLVGIFAFISNRLSWYFGFYWTSKRGFLNTSFLLRTRLALSCLVQMYGTNKSDIA